ncbi:NERD domain-containing protein [Aeromonas salmonicida]|uniref:NERD domain-containing protein n=1 Tax=Aeromonas salmonicida TaxID=645 RepID=UPI00240CE941|nr:NERD domain-containing protein [Aeromonas salmonicida]WFC12633.1 topoisomerase DNA-binding C4 zinc finger domain-containing protein [Aeromonas salmonicida]
MDFPPLIAALLAQLWYVIPLLLLMTIVKTPWFKGMIGEWLITLSIRLFLDKREYHLLNNVTLPLEQGTTQIDHVIVSRFGVFVIETIQQERLAANWQTHKQHVAQLKARHATPHNKPMTARTVPVDWAAYDQVEISQTHGDHIPACPKCGSHMVLRTATRGENKGSQFWGCSGFPKCRRVTLLHRQPP